MKFVLDWSVGVVQRGEIDAVPRGDCFHFSDPLRSDEPSSLRERFEATLQSESHAFEQTSMDHVGEWMPIQNSMKIWCET
jgi:hypothetical protein